MKNIFFIIVLTLCIASVRGQSILEDLAKIKAEEQAKSHINDKSENENVLDDWDCLHTPSVREVLEGERMRDLSTPVNQELGDLYNPSTTSKYDRSINSINTLVDPTAHRIRESQNEEHLILSIVGGAILFIIIMVIAIIIVHKKPSTNHALSTYFYSNSTVDSDRGK